MPRLFLIGLILILVALPAGPAAAGLPADAYTVERYYAESEGESTTTLATFQDKVALTFTPPGTGTKYFLVIGSALVAHASTTYYTRVQLRVDGAVYGTSEFQPSGDALTNYYPFAGHAVVGLSRGSPHTIDIQYCSSTAAQTARIKDACIMALEVANYNTATGNTETTTSTSYVDNTGASITFTPANGVDYLVIATADLAGSPTTKSTYVQVLYDAASWGETKRESTAANHYYSLGLVRRLTGDGASHTIKLQYHAESPETAYIKNGRVSAVRLSDLGTAYYQEAEAEAATQSTAFVDFNTLSLSPSYAGDYLVLASALMRQENNSYTVGAQLYVDNATAYSTADYVAKDGTDYVSYFAVKHLSLTAASHTIDIQHKTNNDASQTEAFMKNARAFAIKINTLESYNDSAHTAQDDTFGTGEEYGYVWGHGLTTGTYKVSWYEADTDGAGTGDYAWKMDSETPLPAGPNDPVASTCHFPDYLGQADAGTWTAIVYDASQSAPVTYDPNWQYTIATDTFSVEVGAIPEFPTLAAALFALALCCGVYLWMRKRLVHAQA